MNTTQENNRLIAEFDGLKFVNDDTESYPNGYMYSTDTGALKIEDLQYNESWDWLMPVLDNINSLNVDSKRYMHDNGSLLADIKDSIQQSVSVVDIESAWDLIVSFIRHYNHANHAKL